MLIFLIALLSIVITLGFYLFKPHKFLWWEFFIPVVSTIAFALLINLIINKNSVMFTEYWGSTITAVFEQEPYNYWKTEICTRSVPCGTDSDGNTEYCTETYDCSHQEDVGPKWTAITNLEEKLTISEKLYDIINKRFGENRFTIESNTNYDSDDQCVNSKGTKFEGKDVGKISYVFKTNWDEKESSRIPYTSKHTYKNKIKASDLSIFNISVVKEKEADSLNLIKYPTLGNMWMNDNSGLLYPTILGDSVSPGIQQKFMKLNGKYGPINKIRLWVLVYNNVPEIIGNYQENYWVRGNKNELVVCMSTDSMSNKLQWAHVFSWTPSEDLKLEIRNYITEIDTLNEKAWNDLYVYLDKNLNRYEKRSFEEFNYLKIEPKNYQIIIMVIFSILISVITSLIVIKNELY